jgi:hypothetical protein
MDNIAREGEYTYEKFPIQITYNTVALLSLFTLNNGNFSDLEDCWVWHYDDPREMAKSAAKQFIDRLEKHYNVVFLIALRNAITDRLKKDDEQFGTNHANKDEII